mmetsp:Transcript_7293/g.8314  ORF Transcript_7293/g.8314 Transcript_7293/m.8314 type:complete len:248 (+) Transcript_7293:318-1061(+)
MKRPSLVMMIESSSSSSLSSSDDELGSSFKRVRISTSPGELRLDRDLSELVATGGEWQPYYHTTNNTNHHYSNTTSKSRRRCRRFYNTTTELILDRTEPLVLILTIIINNNQQRVEQQRYCFPNNSNNNSHCCIRLSISMTRMYPHNAPKLQLLDSTNNKYSNNSIIITTTNNWWTPIKTLSDFIQYTILDQLDSILLMTKTTTPDANNTNYHNNRKNDNDFDPMDHDGSESCLPKKNEFTISSQSI